MNTTNNVNITSDISNITRDGDGFVCPCAYCAPRRRWRGELSTYEVAVMQSHTRWLTPAQARVAVAVARGHGHFWACVPGLESVLSEAQARFEVIPVAAIGIAALDYIRDEALRPDGLISPWVTEGGSVTHETGSGRLTWEIDQTGSIVIEVHRPGAVTDRADWDQIELALRREYHRRHPRAGGAHATPEEILSRMRQEHEQRIPADVVVLRASLDVRGYVGIEIVPTVLHDVVVQQKGRFLAPREEMGILCARRHVAALGKAVTAALHGMGGIPGVDIATIFRTVAVRMRIWEMVAMDPPVPGGENTTGKQEWAVWVQDAVAAARMPQLTGLEAAESGLDRQSYVLITSVAPEWLDEIVGYVEYYPHTDQRGAWGQTFTLREWRGTLPVTTPNHPGGRIGVVGVQRRKLWFPDVAGGTMYYREIPVYP